MEDSIWFEKFKKKCNSKFGVGKFNYSKCIVDGLNSIVVLECLIHKCVFNQKVNSHLKGVYYCPSCIKEKGLSKVRGSYTKDVCVSIAKQFNTLSEFKKKNSYVLKLCRDRGYLKDFHWLNRYYDNQKDILSARKHCIYGYFFPDFNSVYIGLTINLNRRHNIGHCKSGSVFNFCQKNNIEIPIPQIIESGLTLLESKDRGQYWIDHYRNNCYNLINKCRGGGVGTMYNLVKEKSCKEFIEKSNRIHNNKYNYSKVKYINNSTNVCIICPTHGEFYQTPATHVRSYGCKKCNKGKNKYRILTTNDFIKKGCEVHKGKYDYSKTVYDSTGVKVCIICPIHGEFSQYPQKHLDGQECYLCGIEKTASHKRKWVYETCKEESKKYNSRGEFRKNSNIAYQKSCKNGWLDEFYPTTKKTEMVKF